MKNRIKIIASLAVLTVVFVLHQFSCFKSGDSTLFGDIGQSPLRKEAESAQAVEIQDTFRKIFNLYKDRVVFITTEQMVRVQHNPFFDDPFMREFFGGGTAAAPRTEKRRGLGSGFILSEDGYVCTNHHVVAGVDSVTVGINDKNYKADDRRLGRADRHRPAENKRAGEAQAGLPGRFRQGPGGRLGHRHRQSLRP